jgi:hypothetical protein
VALVAPLDVAHVGHELFGRVALALGGLDGLFAAGGGVGIVRDRAGDLRDRLFFDVVVLLREELGVLGGLDRGVGAVLHDGAALLLGRRGELHGGHLGRGGLGLGLGLRHGLRLGSARHFFFARPLADPPRRSLALLGDLGRAVLFGLGRLRHHVFGLGRRLGRLARAPERDLHRARGGRGDVVVPVARERAQGPVHGQMEARGHGDADEQHQAGRQEKAPFLGLVPVWVVGGQRHDGGGIG